MTRPFAGKHIFITAYGGAHVQMIVPVVRALKKLDYQCTVLALTSAQPVLRQLGMEFIGFRDLLEPGDEASIALGKLLAHDLPTQPIDTEESYAYLGLSYRDMELRLGKEEAANIYAHRKRQGFEPVSILERALKKYNPDLVVVTSSPRAEKAAVVAARNLGIPAVAMIDLFGKGCKWAFDPAYADKLLVYSEFTRAYLIAKGRPPNDIVVTGNPSMDRLADPVWKEKGLQWRKEKKWEDKFIIFWASSPLKTPDEDLPNRIDAAILEAMRHHDDWRLIVRFHPSEQIRFDYAGLSVYVSSRTEDITPMLFACDSCLVINSTVGLEAVMINKPLVTVDFSLPDNAISYSELGVSIRANSVADIETCIIQSLEKPQLASYKLPVIGNSTRDVVYSIIEMLK